MIKNAAGADVTKSYEIDYQPGSLVVTARPLTITAASDSKVYDGHPLTNSNVIPTGLLKGDRVASVTVEGSRTDAGFCTNDVLTKADAVIRNEAGEDVTGNYAITYVNGTLTVTPKPVQITITGHADETTVYDGNEHSVNGYDVEHDLPDEYTNLFNAENDITFTGADSDKQASRTEAGTTDMGLTADMFRQNNDNYTMTFVVVDGYQTIQPRHVKVKINGNSATYPYDSQEHTVSDYTWKFYEADDEGNYITDDEGNKIKDVLYRTDYFDFEGTAEAKRMDAGTTEMGLSSDYFTNKNGNFAVTFDVTDGSVTIDPISVTVTITGNTDSKEYDGQEHTVSGYNASANTNLYDVNSDMSFTGEASASRTNVVEGEDDSGKTYMGLSHEGVFANINPNFNPVTFAVTDGYQEIIPIDEVTVTITGNTDVHDYDGTEHTVSGYTAIANNELYDVTKDFTFKGTAEAKRTDAGTTMMGLKRETPAGEEPTGGEPEGEALFVNTNGNFSNVIFEVTDGYQTIRPISAVVTITGQTNTTTYDGEEHTVSGYTAAADTTLFDVTKDFTFNGTDSDKQASCTDVGTTYMGLTASKFAKNNDNFDPVTFIVTDGWIEIEPNHDPVIVRITGANGTFAYSKQGEQSVARTVPDPANPSLKGFTAKAVYPKAENETEESECWLYDTNAITYIGNDTGIVSVSRSEAGTSYMGLLETQFVGDPNFDNVTMEIIDGYITITPLAIVSKTLRDSLATEGQNFIFTLTLKDDLGNDISADDLLKMDDNVEGYVQNGELNVVNDQVRLTFENLEHGDANMQSHAFAIPAGWRLRVVEDQTNYGVSVNGDALSPDDLSYELEMGESSNTYTAAFVNAKEDVCKIGDARYQTISDALAAADAQSKISDVSSYQIEMLKDYIMPAADAATATVPAGLSITLTTALEYSGSGQYATITRDPELTGPMLSIAAQGSLSLGDAQGESGIKLDGAWVSATGAMIANAGTLNVNEGATLCGANNSGNGGAISSTGTVNMNGGVIGGNDEDARNRAVNGGAIYAESGEVNVSGGSIVGNRAVLGASTDGGKGGAIYMAKGSLSVTDEAGITGNSADVDGAAIFLQKGEANFSGGVITENIVTNGGAVGIGASDVRLYFSRNIRIIDNTKPSSDPDKEAEQRNVCLSQNSDEIINSEGLHWVANAANETTNASIGIYVPGTASDKLYLDRGVSKAKFARYSNDAGVQAFSNDRSKGMLVSATDGSILWGMPIKVITRYIGTFSSDTLPPCYQGDEDKGLTDSEYYPASISNYASDIAETLTLPVANSIFACAYRGDAYGVQGKEEQCVSQVSWNVEKGDWEFVDKNGHPLSTPSEEELRTAVIQRLGETTFTNMTEEQRKAEINAEREKYSTLVLYYSMPSYISVANYTSSPLDITSLTVNGLQVGNGFGYVLARNGANVDHFVPIVEEDFTLRRRVVSSETGAGEGTATGEETGAGTGSDNERYINIVTFMLPGVQYQAYQMNGRFTSWQEGAEVSRISYTYDTTTNGTSRTTVKNNSINRAQATDQAGFNVPPSGSTAKLMNDNKTTVNIVFGEASDICKIVEYVKDENGALVKNADGKPVVKEEHCYTSLQEAVREGDKNYDAYKIGVYDDKGTKLYDTVKVELLTDYLIPGSDLPNIPIGKCFTFTTAATKEDKLPNEKYYFTPSKTGEKRAQISRDQSKTGSFITANPTSRGTETGIENTSLILENLIFDGKQFGSGDGGLLKASHCAVTVRHCKVMRFRANNGGAFLVDFGENYVTAPSGNANWDIKNAYMIVEDTEFDDCDSDTESSGKARKGGGGIWTTAVELTIDGCSFSNCDAWDQGGAIFHRIDTTKADNKLKKVKFAYAKRSTTEITGSSFYNCTSRSGGAIELDSYSARMKNCSIIKCAARESGGGVNFYFYEGTREQECAIMEDCTIQDCSAGRGFDNSGGGGVRSVYQATILRNCKILNNSATGSGGGISTSNASNTQYNTKLYLENCTITGNSVTGEKNTDKGGGIYSNGDLIIWGGGEEKTDEENEVAHSTLISDNKLTNNKSKVEYGAGVFLANNRTLTLGAPDDTVVVGAIQNGDTTVELDDSPIKLYIKDNELALINGTRTASNLWLPNTSNNNTINVNNKDCVIARNDLFTGDSTDEDAPSEIHVINAYNLGTQFGHMASDTKMCKGFSMENHAFVGDNQNVYGCVSPFEQTKIVWRRDNIICKITDDQDRLLYFDKNGNIPAVFDALDNGDNSSTSTETAFSLLRGSKDDLEDMLYYYDSTAKEYKKISENALSTDQKRTFKVQMLIPNYQVSKTIYTKYSNRTWEKIVLTTSASSDTGKYFYPSNATTPAKLTRSTSLTDQLLWVRSDVDIENITLDGGSRQSGFTAGKEIVRLDPEPDAKDGQQFTVTLGEGATIQYGKSIENGGGVFINWGGCLVLDKGIIQYCTADGNGGGIYKEGSNSIVTIKEGGIISHCSALNGGGLYYVKGANPSLMEGGCIEYCTATQNGGGMYFDKGNNNGVNALNMSGGSIIGNNAGGLGGGIYVNNESQKIYFSGNAKVTGNWKGMDSTGPACNVALIHDNITVLNTYGLGPDAEIGVYVSDACYDKHGGDGDEFGSRTGSDNLFLFVNDRNGLRGAAKDNDKVKWIRVVRIRVSKEMDSPLSTDTQESFDFRVKVASQAGQTIGVGDKANKMTFDEDGVYSFTLKPGESKYALFVRQNGSGTVAIPASEIGEFQVEEKTTSGFATTATRTQTFLNKDQRKFDDTGSEVTDGTDGSIWRRVSGEIVAGTGDDDKVNVEDICFTNARQYRNLKISESCPDNANKSFSFTVSLTPALTGTFGGIQFNNGTYSFTLTNGQEKTISLPTSIQYSVTQLKDNDFTAEVMRNGSEQLTLTQDSTKVWTGAQTLEPVDQAGGDETLVFTNNRKVGMLKIRKTVTSDIGSDVTGREYTFTVHLESDDSKNVVYDARDGENNPITTVDENGATINGIKFDRDGNATIKLKHDDSITLLGLPNLANYTVTETQELGFNTPPTRKGTIEVGTVKEAAFGNVRQTKGGLKITKTVDGGRRYEGDLTYQFIIRLGKYNQSEGKFTPEATYNKTINDITFKNGVSSTVLLTGGSSKTISGLPSYIDYQVEELEESPSEDVNLDGDNPKYGTIENTTVTVPFTNVRRPGKLTIVNTVDSDLAADADQLFDFKVRVPGLVTTAQASHFACTYAEGIERTPTISVDKGIAEFAFQLKDGERVEITNLPTGVTYTITESAVSGFTTRYANTPDTPATWQSGRVVSDTLTQNSWARFKNEPKKCNLTVGKTVVSDLETDKATGVDARTYSFTVKLEKLKGETTQSYADWGKSTDSDGAVSYTRTYTLKDNESFVIPNLPAGTKFTMTETATPDMTTTVLNVTNKNKSVGVSDSSGNVYATGTLSDDLALSFINTRDSGSLTVSKAVVSDLAKDDNQYFDFKVQLTGLDANVGATDNGVTYGGVNYKRDADNGNLPTATFRLKGGEEKRLMGLPVGASCVVTEMANNSFSTTYTAADGSNVSDYSTSRTISSTEAVVTFTNTRIPGSLTVSKTVNSDLAADKETGEGAPEYKFTVTVSGLKSTADIDRFTCAPETVNVTRTIESDVATFQFVLQHSGNLTISGLPLEADYRVTEGEVDNMATSHGSLAGNVVSGKIGTLSTAAFTNTRKSGELEIRKIVNSDLAADKATGDAAPQYSFTVKVTGLAVDQAERTKYEGANFNDTGTEATYPFSLKDGEKKLISGLPIGAKYTVYEAAVQDMTTTSQDASNNSITLDPVEENGNTTGYITRNQGTIGSAKSVATFTNARETGSLTVSKMVDSDLAADFEQNGSAVTYGFTVTITNLKTSFNTDVIQIKDASGAAINSRKAFSNGTATITFKLANAGSAILTGLPIGAKYAVTEASTQNMTTTAVDSRNNPITLIPVTADGKTTGYTTRDQGTIGADPIAIGFTNTRDRGGNLTVSKTVNSDLAADFNELFDFTVKVSGLGGTASVNSYNFKVGDEIKNYTLANGVATFTFQLKNEDSAIITDLPVGAKYVVTEAAAANMTTTNDENASGTIGTESVATTFTNTRDRGGSLTVSKTVMSALDVDKSKSFDFTVKVTGLGDSASTDSYSFEVGNEKKNYTLANGVATFAFQLSNEGSAIITGLPVGAEYSVAEIAADNMITTAANAANSGIELTAVKADEQTSYTTGSLKLGKDDTATAFINTHLTGNLTIAVDRVISDLRGDESREFSFNVALSDGTVNGTYNGVTFNNGETEEPIKLKGGEIITLTGLPVGVTYTVTEAAVNNMVVAAKDAAGEAIDLTEIKSGDTVTDYAASGEITNGTTSVTTFTNTRLTGKLTVSKVVSSNLASDFAEGNEVPEYGFTVKVTGLSAAMTTSAAKVKFKCKKEDVEVECDTLEAGSGTATFTFKLKNGENLTIEGLPTEASCIVTETARIGMTTTYKNGNEDARGAYRREINKDGITAAFTNTRDTNSITIVKKVESDLPEDKSRSYSFTMTVSGLSEAVQKEDFSCKDESGNTFKYKENDDDENEVVLEPTLSDNSSVRTATFTFKLKDEESLTIAGLPVGAEYEMVENTQTEDMTATVKGSATVMEQYMASGTIESATTQKAGATVTFIDTRNKGNLKLSKKVVSPILAERMRSYSFTIVLDSEIDKTYSNVAFVKGVASVSLQGGGSKTITGLPAGVNYTVTESAVPYMDVTAKDEADKEINLTEIKSDDTVTGYAASGRINSSKTAMVEFTNERRTGKLTVTKTVNSHTPSDFDKEFTFTVQLSGATIEEGMYNDESLVGMDFDATGKAVFTLKGKDGENTVTAGGLPVGINYIVTEKAVNGFTTSYSDEKGDPVASYSVVGEIGDTESVEAFTNTRDETSLTITKNVVSDLAADKATGNDALDYAFTVKLDQKINATYYDNDNENPTEFVNGQSEVRLKDGETRSIVGLPKGVTYTVTETQATNMTTTHKIASGSDVQSNSVTGKLESDDGDGVTFTNTRQTGELEIRKQLVSNRTKDSELEFNFTVKVTGLKVVSEEDRKRYTDAGANLNEEGTEATYTFSLKGSENKLISGLPIGATYTVTETVIENMTVAAEDAAGNAITLSAVTENEQTTGYSADGQIGGAKSVAAFTDTRELGNLVVSKVLVSDLAADRDLKFTIQVTLDDDKISGQYRDMKFADGVATLELRGGESKTAVGLPTDVKFTVSETENTDFDTVNEVKCGDAIDYTTGNEGTICVGDKANAQITNTRKTCDLTITKNVDSDQPRDLNAEFKFVVTLDDDTIGEPTEDAPNGKTFGEGENAILIKNGVSDTITLKHGESWTIAGLPTGVKITIEELTDQLVGDTGFKVSELYVTTASPGVADSDDEADAEVYAASTNEGHRISIDSLEADKPCAISFTNKPAVCKITINGGNNNGELLYLDQEHTLPAVFPAFDNTVVEALQAPLYRKASTNEYSGKNLAVKMVVPQYTLMESVDMNGVEKQVTLTTADRGDSDYPYTGATNNNVATVTRGFDDEGSMFVSSGTLTIGNITLDGNSKGTEGQQGGIIKVESGTLSLSADASLVYGKAGQGGAIYVASGTVNMLGGEINGNTATVAGAGIYLSEGATLKLSGNPSFGGTDRYADGSLKGMEGNFVTMTREQLVAATGTGVPKNGTKDYAKEGENYIVRQDIYLDEVAAEGTALTSIALTGNLDNNVPAGSIWVWAAGTDNTQLNHYYMLKQFAVLDTSFSGTVSDVTYNAFRNARADADTDCGGDYLTGQSGENIGNTKCIYWTGGFDFSFLKVDGFDAALAGAKFKLYTSYTSTSENVPYQKGGADVEAESSNGTDTTKFPDPEDNTKAQAKGTVFFSKVAPKDYYMIETTVPSGYVANTDEVTTIYKVTIASDGTPTIRRKLLSEDEDKYVEVYKVQTEAAKAATATEPAEPAKYQYHIMNTPTIQRKVILKKVAASTYTPLPGAKFRIFRADMSEIIDTDYGYNATDKCFTSLASGVYFIGDLPEGRYYLLETGVPSGAAGTNAGKVFILIVDTNGVTQRSLGDEAGELLGQQFTGDDAVENLKTWLIANPQTTERTQSSEDTDNTE